MEKQSKGWLKSGLEGRRLSDTVRLYLVGFLVITAFVLTAAAVLYPVLPLVQLTAFLMWCVFAFSPYVIIAIYLWAYAPKSRKGVVVAGVVFLGLILLFARPIARQFTTRPVKQASTPPSQPLNIKVDSGNNGPIGGMQTDTAMPRF